MSDKFKVVHAKTHALLLEKYKKSQPTDSTENKKSTNKVPPHHIEAHKQLLQNQKQIIGLDSLKEINLRQQELEAQMTSLQQEQQYNENPTREIKYPQID